jgi:hypothetical protein
LLMAKSFVWPPLTVLTCGKLLMQPTNLGVSSP